MEDILASIRKILSEDDGEAVKLEPVKAEPEPEPEPMMDEPEEPVASIFAPEPEEEPTFNPEPDMPLGLTGSMMAEEQVMQQLAFEPEPPYAPEPYDPNYQHLVSDPVASASGASIAQLAHAVARERAVHLGSHGVTLEQLVRDILNPILKHWIATNLPYMVERIVKQEIERIVTRSDRM